MTYLEHLEILKSNQPILGEIVARWRNLEDILKKHSEAGATLEACDIVQQDEYSYDFLLQAKADCWLSFGVS